MNIAIVIGVSQYSGALAPLPACKNDAAAISVLLKGSSRFDDVLLLVENTTADAVKQGVVEFVTRHKSDEVGEVFFYFSGHGHFAGTEFYYLLSDHDSKRLKQTAFENSEIDNLLRALNPKLAVKIVDACASGMTYIKEPENSLETYLKGTKGAFHSCYFMFSSHLDQSSYADAYMSYFTRSFVHAVLNHSALSIRYKDFIDHISDAFEGDSQQKPFFVVQADFTDQFSTISDTMRRDLRIAAGISDVAEAGVSVLPRKTTDPLSGASPLIISEEDTIETDLANRLAELKRFPAVGSDEHYTRLNERINAIATKLQKNIDHIRTFGFEKRIDGPNNVFHAIRSFSEPIVRSVESEGYRPLHHVKSARETHQHRQTLVEHALGYLPPTPTTSKVYILQQRHNYPDSCVTVVTSSDSHVPAGLLFFYLLPLQLRACLYAGVAVKGEANAAEEDWSLSSLTHVLLDLDDTDEERIDHFIMQRISAFNSTLRSAVARRVKLLEDEKNHGL